MGAARLNINLNALKANYQYLDSCSAPTCNTGAAVKADAYGLGMLPVSHALYDSGCRHFFVAQADEAVTLRRSFAEKPCHIFVLEGPRADDLKDYQAHKLTPIINTADQFEHLVSFNRINSSSLPSALHLDTAMSRLGLAPNDVQRLAEHLTPKGPLPLCLVLSHLACADDPQHSLNTEQLKLFSTLAAQFENSPKSLANSAGILQTKRFHFDLTRPGISLYGAMTDPTTKDKQLTPVLNWQAEILQIRHIDKGQSVGYGAEFTAETAMKLATIGVGYADGYARSLYQPERNRIALVGIDGHAAPLVGRVSMDLIVADVSKIPESVLQKAKHADLIWPGYPLEQMALDRQTIAYEVMTGLGGRAKRHYDDWKIGSAMREPTENKKMKAE